MADPEPQVRVIRERGKQKRATIRYGVKQHATVKIPAEVAARKEVTTHRYAEEHRLQEQNLTRRLAFRRGVTEESLRRRRVAAGEQRREQLRADVLQKSGARPASVGVASGIIRVFAVIFALSILFLLVSRGSQAGNAIQKVGAFLGNITSSQPLFKKTA